MRNHIEEFGSQPERPREIRIYPQSCCWWVSQGAESKAQAPRRVPGTLQFPAVPNTKRGRGGLPPTTFWGYRRDKKGMKRNRRETYIDMRKRGLPQEVQLTLLFPFSSTGADQGGTGEGFHPAEWGKSRAARSPQEPC